MRNLVAAAQEVSLWQRFVMGLAGLMVFVVGGVLFDTWGKKTSLTRLTTIGDSGMDFPVGVYPL